jgi:hypothetical protein
MCSKNTMLLLGAKKKMAFGLGAFASLQIDL